MKKCLSFDDVLIEPQFSEIESRIDVDTRVDFCGVTLKVPVISSNMDSVTGPAMAKAMRHHGGIGALHRFCTIEENVEMYKEAIFFKSYLDNIVSIGIGEKELERAEALYHAGANIFLVDVAHGASRSVVDQVKELRKLLTLNTKIIVGNFATAKTIRDFKYHLGDHRVDAWKVGIGGGSACLTRVVTGCGLPTLESIIDCSTVGDPIIGDGGIRTSGDFAKALAAGATTVMVGGMLAGCDESPGELVNQFGYTLNQKPDELHEMMREAAGIQEWLKGGYTPFKKYRGSASKESYEVQGKLADHRTPEGEAFLVPYTGPVANVLQKLDAGLRSSMSYVGANNLTEFRELASLVEITSNGAAENKAHGKQ